MVMKIFILIFLCATLSRTAKAEEEECHIYERESSKIKNQYVTEIADIFFKESLDKPYLKLNQTVIDSIPGGAMSLAIVYDDGDSKNIVNIIHLKDKKNNVDESDSEYDSYEDIF